jgi:citrate synthase
MQEKPKINLGLEGIYFTESRIAMIDGINGRLYYCGYSIESLAENSTYEETCYLILHGKLPKKEELERFSAMMKESREIPQNILSLIKDMAKTALPMDILRTAISALPAYQKKRYEDIDEENFAESINIISKSTSIIAAIERFRKGLDYIKPDSSLGHAANFLYMLKGTPPDSKHARILDIMMILHAEHGSNASTFTAIAAASTLSDLYSAIVAGICALKGPLHGGADEASLRMLYAIGEPENTSKYIEDALSGKKRIMGFGHRIYKNYDPRARIIKKYLEELEGDSDEKIRKLAKIEMEAEKIMIERLGKQKGIWPNVDFFSGPVYLSLGISQEIFTPLFAASRSVGWCAHVIEYWKTNRLIRPLDYYTGEIDMEYTPISER